MSAVYSSPLHGPYLGTDELLGTAHRNFLVISSHVKPNSPLKENLQSISTYKTFCLPNRIHSVSFSNQEKFDMLACTKKSTASIWLFEILKWLWAPHVICLAVHFENPTQNEWVRISVNIIANWTTVFNHLGYSCLIFHSTIVRELIVLLFFFPYL